MIIKFIIEIEVEDNITDGPTKFETIARTKQAKKFDEILSNMEELVAKEGFDIYDQEWVAIA